MNSSLRISMPEQCQTCERSGSCIGETQTDKEAALQYASARDWTSAEGSPTRILLCSDNPIMRRALHLLIATRTSYHVAMETAICPHALRLLPDLGIDVVLLDYDLIDPSDEGLAGLMAIFAAAPAFRLLRDPQKELPVLILTTEPDPEACHRAFQQGVRGLVIKNKTTDDLFGAIERVSRGESWLEGPALEKLLRQGQKPKARCSEDEKIALLTKREREIIEVVAFGKTNRQIGQQLFISGATVRHHLCAIFEKLGVTTRGELIVYAYRHHLADRSYLEAH